VTTWSRPGLCWGGWRLRDVYEQIVAPRAEPPSSAHYLLARGLDGFRATMLLEDAFADDVLLADTLDGEPLTIDHGAPLRLVAPAHYAYKSVKHLCRLELRDQFPRGVRGGREHPRARVALEERGMGLPGWLLRRVYRASVPLGLWWYRRAERNRPNGDLPG
jgi:DMSO/TMAO reductase YedYZ molybdopterin-dependent catalytic subunit